MTPAKTQRSPEVLGPSWGHLGASWAVTGVAGEACGSNVLALYGEVAVNKLQKCRLVKLKKTIGKTMVLGGERVQQRLPNRAWELLDLA